MNNAAINKIEKPTGEPDIRSFAPAIPSACT